MHFEYTLAQAKAAAAAWASSSAISEEDAVMAAALISYLNGCSVPGTADSSIIIITHPK